MVCSHSSAWVKVFTHCLLIAFLRPCCSGSSWQLPPPTSSAAALAPASAQLRSCCERERALSGNGHRRKAARQLDAGLALTGGARGRRSAHQGTRAQGSGRSAREAAPIPDRTCVAGGAMRAARCGEAWHRRVHWRRTGGERAAALGAGCGAGNVCGSGAPATLCPQTVRATPQRLRLGGQGEVRAGGGRQGWWWGNGSDVARADLRIAVLWSDRYYYHERARW